MFVTEEAFVVSQIRELSGLEVTVKDEPEFAEPPGAVTPMAPVFAPEGTLVTIWVAVADVTVAATPLNCTAF